MATNLEDDLEDHIKLIKIGAFEKMANYHCKKESHKEIHENRAKEMIKSLTNLGHEEVNSVNKKDALKQK